MENARKEAEMVMFGAVRDVLAKTGLKPKQIGVLVVNCSLFNPTPSLAACVSVLLPPCSQPLMSPFHVCAMFQHSTCPKLHMLWSCALALTFGPGHGHIALQDDHS